MQIVEFYAPWCGHCQNLKPAYEKAARDLAGLAKVAAVNCDDEVNKPFCGSMGVQGFPTLKTVRPSQKPGGRPVVEDYQGPRTAKAITDDVVAKINNHVVRVADKDLEAFLAREGPKALLFTDKGMTSALLRAVAIDYLGVVSIGQVRNKEKTAVEKFGIEKFPTLVLISDKDEKPVTYDGELNKKDIVQFLSRAGQPNPDQAPSAKDNKGKQASPSSKTSKDEKTRASKKQQAVKPEPTQETEEAEEPSTTAVAAEGAAETPHVIAIPTVADGDVLVDTCLRPKSHTCVLALVPAEASDEGDKATASLSHLNTKYLHGNRHMFPILSVPSSVEASSSLRAALKLSGSVEVIALNARRGWWRHYEGDFGIESVEGWIDAIRMGEGGKSKLPKEVVVDEPEPEPEAKTEPEPEAKTEPEPAAKAEESAETSTTAAEPEAETEAETEAAEPEAKTEAAEETIVHEEL